MKKILSVLAVMLAVVVFTSCNSRMQQQKQVVIKQPSDKELLLKEGKRQLNEYIKDSFCNPDETKIRDMEVVELRDSLCILNFRFVAENKYGGHVNGKGQFILLTHNKKHYVSFMSNYSDSPHCIGSDWLGELSDMLAFTLPMEYAEKDSFVKRKCCKKNTFDGTDEYIQAYCIVKKFGKSLNAD